MTGNIDWSRAFHDPGYFAQKVLEVELHPGQLLWLQHSTRRENALVTGNRWGKSYACAVKLLHHAIFRPRPIEFDNCPHYRMVTASITQDQARIVFTRAVSLARQSRVLAPLISVVAATPYPRMEFFNGSIIEARSTQNRGEYLLGHDYDLFIFDEVAFESHPEYVVEEVIFMRLADRAGRLDLVSTPNGKNWFYRRVQEIIDGRRPGYSQSGDSRENTHISRDFIDERVMYYTERHMAQNIMGQFVDSGGEILRGEYIDNALTADNRDYTDARFISGWDLARKETATVGITVAVSDGHTRIVALERFRRFDWNVITEKIRNRQYRYPGELVVDGTGLGDVVAEQLREFHPTAVIFTAATKAEMLSNVELFHARGTIHYDRWELPDGPGRIWSLEDELRAARWDDNNRYDGLMALALALRPLRRRETPLIAPRVAGF
jgi:hypothetical protein